MYEVLAKGPMDVGKSGFMEKPKFVSKVKNSDSKDNKSNKEVRKAGEDTKKDEGRLGKRVDIDSNAPKTQQKQDQHASKNKKLVNTNTLSFDD